MFFQGHLRKTLVKPMCQLTETHKKVGTWGGGAPYIYICIHLLYPPHHCIDSREKSPVSEFSVCVLHEFFKGAVREQAEACGGRDLRRWAEDAIEGLGLGV